MAERKGYILQEDTDFAFESNGKQYKLSILISNGMLILREGKDLQLNHIYIIDEPCKQYEVVATDVEREGASEPSTESLEVENTTDTPKPKKSVKKAKKKKKK